MEAIDEFEAEGDQQSDQEQQIRQKRRGTIAAFIDVGVKAVRDKEDAGRQ